MFPIQKHIQLGDTKAAKVAGEIIGQVDRTVREWRAYFNHDGTMPETKQKKYERSGILWTNEDPNRKATTYI